MNPQKPIYVSKTNYELVIIFGLSSILTPLIRRANSLELIIEESKILIILFFISFLFLKKYRFYDSYFVRYHPFLSFIRKTFPYEKLTSVEIKKRNEPRSNPRFLLHYSKKRSTFNPSFPIKNIAPLTPLVECLVQNNVFIYLNFTSDFNEDKRYLISYITIIKGDFSDISKQ